MPEDVSAIVLVGGSSLIIICVLFGMAKSIISDYLERKEEAAEKERAEQTVEMS